MSEWKGYFKYFMQRSQFDWDNAENRRAFLDEFYRLIVTRVRSDVPNLRAIFRPKQIELLLLDSMDAWDNEIQSSDTISFIKFVVKSGYRDEPELDEDGKPLVHRNTPVHYATLDRFHDKYQIVRELFKIYDNYDVNYTDESGFSHMHAAVLCGFIDIIEKFLEHGQDLNCLAPISGDSLLYVAVKFGKKAMVEFLWRRGIDPNLANAEGLTPLHLICNKYNDDMVKLFFRLNDENGRRLKFDVRDKQGRTPLLYAAAKKHMHEYAARVMLSNGADLNLTDDEGWTCLHWLCKWHALEGTKLFFRLSEEFNRPIAIDARDKLGNAPLHVTMRLQMSENPMELLLRQGADPNAVNAEGSTPLHLICMIDPIELHAETFFGTCDEIGKTVLIDAKDKLGRTPLQWAVENVLADKVDVLLDRGADLSSFVFPAEDYFNEKLLRHRMLGNHTLQLVTDALHIVERLEKGGYEVNRSDVLHIMKLFAKRGLFAKQHYDDEKFAQEGKEIMVIPGTSLYDLTRIKPEGLAAKTLALTLADYSKFVCTREYWFLRRSDFRGSLTHLAELAARGFFRVWALDCFMELTHYRLPSLCCEMIVDELTNQDLFNICLAACGESS